MTIRKGEPWGSAVERPHDLRLAHSDAELAAMVVSGVPGPLGLSGGDLHRAVGSPGPRTEMQRLPIDLLEVTADGCDHVAVAHVVARRSWWRGRLLVATNVDHVGDWNVAPRAHPNDGRFDVVDVDERMPLRQRWQARARLRSGTHVPHPMISTRTATEMVWAFAQPVGIWIDGVRAAEARSLSIRVRPDAFAVVV